MERKHPLASTKFFQRIGDPSECWEWTGAKNDKGYGQISVNGEVQYAHRVMYAFLHGEIPPGVQICHYCDNPGCVRPNHLFAGSSQDNAEDSMNKLNSYYAGQQGSKHGMSKLNEDDVKEIRRLRSVENMTHDEIGDLFGVGRTAIQKILTGQTWTHVK